MAATSLAICKRAAQILGAGPANVTSIDSPSTYEDTEFSVAYPARRDAELRKHRWNFAKKKIVLVKRTILDITAITAANPPVVTSAAHGLSDDDIIYIDSVSGMTEVNDRTYTVANKTTNTFELSGIDGSAWTAYSSGGKLYDYVPWPYSYAYALPSDYLQLIQLENVVDFDLDGTNIYCDTDTELAIEYIYTVTDTTSFDALFDEALAADLAYHLCETITQSNSKKAEALEAYEKAISWARRTNAFESGPKKRKVKPTFVEVRR